MKGRTGPRGRGTGTRVQQNVKKPQCVRSPPFLSCLNSVRGKEGGEAPQGKSIWTPGGQTAGKKGIRRPHQGLKDYRGTPGNPQGYKPGGWKKETCDAGPFSVIKKKAREKFEKRKEVVPKAKNQNNSLRPTRQKT